MRKNIAGHMAIDDGDTTFALGPFLNGYFECGTSWCMEAAKELQTLCDHPLMVAHKYRGSREHQMFDVILRHGMGEAILVCDTRHDAIRSDDRRIRAWLKKVHRYEDGGGITIEV